MAIFSGFTAVFALQMIFSIYFLLILRLKNKKFQKNQFSKKYFFHLYKNMRNRAIFCHLDYSYAHSEGRLSIQYLILYTRRAFRNPKPPKTIVLWGNMIKHPTNLTEITSEITNLAENHPFGTKIANLAIYGQKSPNFDSKPLYEPREPKYKRLST